MQVGQRVFFWRALSGSYAEKALVEEVNMASLPDVVDFEQGAAVPVPYFTAYRAIQQRYHTASHPIILTSYFTQAFFHLNSFEPH